ncbi:hypothetical protein [Roseivivax halodurans]|uniref:hypothetical protein n=1 Tax=Roseivivax halodurans TaxID=93683 RepID=UPI0012FC821A|nr:hypothetical protein [Roseivivax halodurans]
MRKIDPLGVFSDFCDQLDEQSIFYEETWEAFQAASRRKIASENYALSIGVMFEGFINDLIFAYANRDCSRVMEHLTNSLEDHLRISKKAHATFEHFGEIKERRHLTVPELRGILDPDGRNDSFRDYREIERRATQWLSEDTGSDLFSWAPRIAL